MSEPFLAEVRIVGFNFAPRGWAQCDGQILPIDQNQSLYSLLGTTYGGDGRTTFALPDLRGRVPIHDGNDHTIGDKAGEETHILSEGELPNHQHALQASGSDGDASQPAGNVLAREVGQTYQPNPPSTLNLKSDWIATAGNSQGHQNMQPYLVLNFVIALRGTFPSRN